MKNLKATLLIIAAMSSGLPMTAQVYGQVHGTVTDDNHNAIPGVAVVVSGATIGTSTDDSGFFELRNVPAGSELEFSSLGYADVRTGAVFDKEMQIVMREDATFLNTLVVVGYGVQKKSDLTGAISSVNAEETLKKMPVNQVSDLLQGRVAGLSVVSSSGAAGSSQVMRVRGVNSIKADGGPNDLAYRCLNLVRERAFGDKSHALGGLSADEFDKAVFDEFGWENVFEFKRWFQLVRTERVDECLARNPAVGARVNVSRENYLFPVPVRQAELRKWKNNPGY